MTGMRRLTPATLLLAWVGLIHAGPASAPPLNPGAEDSKVIKARVVAVDYKEAVVLCNLKGLAWTGDLAKALAKAGKDKNLVFLEFAAASNISSKYNHQAVFTKPAVKEALKPYVLVMLYIDLLVPDEFFKEAVCEEKRHAESEANNQFEKDAFFTAAIPLCVILKPVGDGAFKVVGRYDEARINNEEKFVDFLQSPFASDK